MERIVIVYILGRRRRVENRAGRIVERGRMRSEEKKGRKESGTGQERRGDGVHN